MKSQSNSQDSLKPSKSRELESNSQEPSGNTADHDFLRPSIKNAPDSQEQAYKLVRDCIQGIADGIYEGYDITPPAWAGDPYQTTAQQLTEQLLQLALSCLPEKFTDHPNEDYMVSYNHVIDTIEQKIKERFS